ncbi:MAG: hypothetical protein ABW101_07660 [Candidatus Thiodiazotropha sp.]
MAHTFDMRRLHHGCGESLQSNLFELMLIKSLPRAEKLTPELQTPRSEDGRSEPSRDERFWG